MRATALHRLRVSWPIVGVFLSFVAGLAVGGIGGGVLAGTVSVLVIGPAYLIQNGVRRRRGTMPAPRPKTPAEQARSDARSLRMGAVTALVSTIVALIVVAAGVVHGSLAVLLLIGAACSVTSAPHSWAIAERRETGRSLRWAWALSAAFDVVFGFAAVAIAITNQRSHWIGGWIWTAVFAGLAVLWLLGAPADVRRARR